MTVQKVLTWPHKGLRVVAEEVTDWTSEQVQDCATDLRDTLKAYNAQGLAATQIGVPLRMLAYKEPKGTTMVLINPTLTAKGDEVDSSEGCISFPGVSTRLKRSSRVIVDAITVFGDVITLTLDGLEAVAIQHELDHLNGVVMIDHLRPTAKRFALKKLKKVKKRLGAYAVGHDTRLTEAVALAAAAHK